MNMRNGNNEIKWYDIKQWNGVASWPWYIDCDCCAICIHQVIDLCGMCKANPNTATYDSCPIVFGECNHAFHYHCITRWLRSHTGCPLDGLEWKNRWFGFNSNP